MTFEAGPWQVFGTELLDKLGMVIALPPGAQPVPPQQVAIAVATDKQVKYSRADSLAGDKPPLPPSSAAMGLGASSGGRASQSAIHQTTATGIPPNI
jgi:hypothetical protein